MRIPSMHDYTDLFEAVPLGSDVKQRVHLLLSGADRFYHGVNHVALLWRRHRVHAREAGLTDPRANRLIACAILFHDCVYAANRNDNEERSALVWLEASADDRIDGVDRAWVADTIRATRDHLAYSAGSTPVSLEALRLWLLDLDLTPFGEVPDVFDRNIGLLRAEAPHLNRAAFDAARLKLLRRFAEAPIIYRTPVLAACFETAARRNLYRHLVTV